MAASKFLAVDFGASSGRAIIGKITPQRIILEEIHRFNNQPVNLLGSLYWDFPYLFNELKKGISQAVKNGHDEIQGIGIDSWGVDFGLLTRDNQLLGNPFAYRDARTDGMMEKAFLQMPANEIYALTGIQFLQLNSIFQLFSMVDSKNCLLDLADSLLFMPDLFNFFLTGEKTSEYTIASTSQLLNANTREWEPQIFDRLKLPLNLFQPIIEPATFIGKLLPAVTEELNIAPLDVIAAASHDTASAVIAVPVQTSADWAYLSSGTWSLLGMEIEQPIITPESLRHNFTNEGGVDNSIRFLRNTMGLWLLQRCMAQWSESGEAIDYSQLADLVSSAQPFQSLINPDDITFLNPPDMAAAIQEFCRQHKQPIPTTKGEIIRCILESLALKYRYICDLMNDLRPAPLKRLHIVGGGSQNELLNQFTANATGLEVIAGPSEATALGNIIVQAIATRELSSIKEGRELIAQSFQLNHFQQTERDCWEQAYQRAKPLFFT